MRYAILDSDRKITNIIEIAADTAKEFDAHYVGEHIFAIGDMYPTVDLVPSEQLLGEMPQAVAVAFADRMIELDTRIAALEMTGGITK